ncbi:MAG: glycoside hydrolase family 38 C-terminal domain-containing protein, partial [Phycisphaerae bacterium]
LTEHSAGTLTSQSYMKRWNRKGELLADAAERAATLAWTLGVGEYPRQKLERGWVRILASQMHDILPGTSIPRAYRYSWNDDAVAMNLFASVLSNAIGQIASQLDTKVEGQPLVVFNPLATSREDLVQIEVELDKGDHPRVYDAAGKEVPSQTLQRKDGRATVLFAAQMEANSVAVFDLRRAQKPYAAQSSLSVTSRSLENDWLRVVFNDAGDVASIVDKKNGRELLRAPATLEFTYERPRQYPAWNMDWEDRQQPPIGKVEGRVRWSIVEDGPVRVALAVTRESRNSVFTQTYQLAAGDSGRVVEVDTEIDWQSTSCTVKAAFPLKASNPVATYNWGCGTIERGNNQPVQYEVPSHEWFDLTDSTGNHGVTILDDSKYGSDKPNDHTVRLTLLYTPGVRGGYMDQHSQDWGVHHMRYGLYPHDGGWRAANCEQRGRRFNQPLYAFAVPSRKGALGRQLGMVSTASSKIDIRAIKVAEESDRMIVRVQELKGMDAKDVELQFPFPVDSIEEVDGQERFLRKLIPTGNRFVIDVPAYGLRTFAIALSAPDAAKGKLVQGVPVPLPFNLDGVSADSDFSSGAVTADGKSYPAEQFPSSLVDQGIRFELGSAVGDEKQLLACQGQKIQLPNAVMRDQPRTLHLLVAGTQDVSAPCRIGNRTQTIHAQRWAGFVGQWYDRVWDREHGKVDYKCDGQVRSLLPAFMKKAPIAWFATHRHDPEDGNEAYHFTYLFHEVLSIPAGVSEIELPFDERVLIAAASLSTAEIARPLHALVDQFPDAKPISIRHRYDADRDRVFTGRSSESSVRSERVRSFADITLGKPNEFDDIGSGGFEFRVFDPDGRRRVHSASGAVDGSLPRLNDNLLAENHDDVKRCVWYDNEGRFTLDLGQQRRIDAIRTYSWHRTNRAPQFFSVWGSKSDEMPDPGFGVDDNTEWKLLGVVDTRELRDGWIHVSRMSGKDQADADNDLGVHRHLLWILEDIGEGTFTTEIDIDFK